MRRLLGGLVVMTAIVVVAGFAYAQMGGGMGSGMMGSGMMGGGMGSGMMGSGMMGGGLQNQPGSPDGQGADAGEPSLTADQARALAQQYVDAHLKEYTVDRVLPFTGMHGTMYSVELKGPNDEIRILHVNPWGNVMPFGGPSRRAS